MSLRWETDKKSSVNSRLREREKRALTSTKYKQSLSSRPKFSSPQSVYAIRSTQTEFHQQLRDSQRDVIGARQERKKLKLQKRKKASKHLTQLKKDATIRTR
eukprot:TRINITY_DN50226_c1_g1_i1.p1 TRINITY_DN50226_c1_g1~~TRINITY_DN50226_c1_g1_i1.p1  ORF type:complete len:102 (+),score=16.36 TRINITY_DN50226_c1_g1_i1:140-445(+)